MSGKSCDCRMVAGYSSMEHEGDFYYTEVERLGPSYISIMLPGHMFITIPIVQGAGVRGKAWGWDGNLRSPTLTPSIFTNRGKPGEWHGFMRNGRLESC